MKHDYPYIVSACLAGERCRYDGGSNLCPAVAELVRQGRAIPACPEMLGGLPCPRTPCEKSGGRILSKDGQDCTQAFHDGALAAMRLARAHGCRAAIVKSRSPSCGSGLIYDGTFSRRLVPGDGVWVSMLRAAGFALYTEESLPNDAETADIR
ncbi:MAG: DUF523 domain-containing protein [Desulfovibrionaceae bacterium]|nr:DUF523 domain-containing protein [Desulfovibrionaceae bacterium]